MNQWRTIVGAAACAAMAAGIGVGLTWPADAQNTALNNAAGGAGRVQVISTASPSAGSGQSGGSSGTGGAGGTGASGGSGQGSNGQGSSGGGSQGASSSPSGASGTTTPSAGASASASASATLNLTQILGPVRILFDPTPKPTKQTPGTPCLVGYVWRQAVEGDYICVTPATRTQTEADNAAAASRVNPQGGPYGPDTCLQGYVWRQVVPSDHVCVTEATRSQVAADNAQEINRELLMSLWLSDWTPPAPPQNCNGNVCTVTDGGGGAQFQVNGENFNFGQVVLDIRSDSNNSLVWTSTVTAQTYTGFLGAALYAQTPLLDCTTDPSATANDYLQAYDEVSGQWSAKVPVNSDCASF